MKTAISLPEGVFKLAERYARRHNKSRSKLYAEAIAEYLARHATNEITESMNTVADRIGKTTEQFHTAAARSIIEQEPW
jgi:metal-responsive CopG/Arc/MetJ family transcriptional regulator